MKPYVIYSALICFFVFEHFNGQQIVKQCPLDIASWHKRSTVLDCDAKDLAYHCILTHNATLYEVCIDRKIYEANRIGCPWIHFHNNEPIFGAKNTKCPIDLNGCPPKEHRGYESDQLYLYPKCLVPEKDRFQKRANVTITYVHVTQTTPLDDSDSKIVEICVIVLMSGLLILCFLVILYVWKRRNHAKRDNAAESQFVDCGTYIAEKPQFVDCDNAVEPQFVDCDNAAETQSVDCDNEAELQFVDCDTEAKLQLVDCGDSEMRPVPMKQLRDQFVSVCKYNCIRHSGCQYHRKSKTANSETRIVIFKCMDRIKLLMEIEAFKDRIDIYPPFESAPLIERINEIRHRFQYARYRFQTMIVVFFDVNKSTVDIVRDFTRLLQECFHVSTCIAFSNDKDVFLDTNEMLLIRGSNIDNVNEDLADLQRGEEEYTIVDDSQLKKEYPLVYHITKYITHQTGTEPDSRFLHQSFSFLEIKERI